MIKTYLRRLNVLMPLNDDYEEDFEDLQKLSGAMDAEIAQLKEVYPDCPKLLTDLLQEINGTYWRDLPGDDRKAAVPILASMDYCYPNYLLSVAQMIEDSKDDTTIRAVYGSYMDEMELDSRINPDLPFGKWLHFTACINNGGSSNLYIDFDPQNGGVKGQIVQHIHDPDSYKVIADSFEEYLKGLIEADFPFLEEE